MTNPAKAANALRVLVVEDSALDYGLIVRLLEASGWAVTARRVEEEDQMKAALASEHWDAVISDHNLPKFSSIGALVTLKNTGSDIPFLIVSGDIGEELAVDAMLAGADDYVIKARIARLPPALRRSLAGAADRRQRRLAERALAQSEDRLKSLVAHLPGALLQISAHADGRINVDYASDGTRGLFGITQADITGAGETMLGAVADADRESLAEALCNGTRELRWQGRLAAAADGERWVEIAASVRLGDQGLRIWDALALDISTQKRAEQALRELSGHLERAKEAERRSIAR